MGLLSLEFLAKRIAARDGGRISRPVHPGSKEAFPLTYVRTGPRRKTPILVIPGGPGIASVIPYRPFRREAARRGLDVIMVEHRGVGLSSKTFSGNDLPAEAVTIEAAADDLAAVLYHLGVSQVVVAGSSYGSYLAQVFAIRHPHFVKDLILDSPMLSVHFDLAQTRRHRHFMFWGPRLRIPSEIAHLVRQLARRGESKKALSRVVEVVYEFAGAEALERLLSARLRGRLGWLWKQIANSAEMDSKTSGVRFFHEPALMDRIAYEQLGFALPTDGSPLDPQQYFTDADSLPDFRGEPVNLPVAIPHYPWPTIVLSGDRDLQTPSAIARRIVSLAPHGVFVRLRNMGHSALDTHYLALMAIVQEVLHGRYRELPTLTGQLAKLPRRGVGSLLSRFLTTVINVTA